MSKLGVDHGSSLCTDPSPLRENPEWRGVCTQAIMGVTKNKTTFIGKVSLRTADAFPVVASLPPKNSVCEPERQNDFRDVKPFVLMLANQIKG